jgi:hypothetical protein
MPVTAKCSFESLSPLSFSRHYIVDKLPKEQPHAYEVRTWRERAHVNDDGFLYVPPMAFKLCLSEAAKYLSMKVPGKGQATYTKHFEAGILVLEPLVLPVKKDDVQGEWLFLPSDGRRGGTKRVDKCFPLIPKWSGDVTFFVLDTVIEKDVFETHVREMGNFIGIGRFRPRQNGYYGRFKLTELDWQVT